MTTSRSILSHSLQLDNSGSPAPGARAYFYLANTTTPLTVFRDAAASTPHTHPVIADGRGRFPAIYIPFQSYREVVTDATGAAIHDEDDIPNVDPASGSGGGGGGGVGYSTGDIKPRLDATPETGWVRLNGNTIGSATSGASERANGDCEDLFLHLWNKISDSGAPVIGGRGASAAADWASNKRLTLPNMQERVLAGVRGMGGTATSLFLPETMADPTIVAAAGGSAAHTLTVAQMPVHDHPATSIVSDPGHSHFSSNGQSYPNGGGSNIPSNGQVAIVGTSQAALTGITVSTDVGNTGSGHAHQNVQPVLMCYYYIKL